MPTTPNKLMPTLQFTAAMIILLIFGTMALGPMFGAKPADTSMAETEKAIILILVGFLFGSAVGSAKKDDQNAALTAQILAAPPAAPSFPDPQPKESK